jgi:hypothetical protein
MVFVWIPIVKKATVMAIIARAITFLGDACYVRRISQQGIVPS